jgi:pantoate--beta-alanine ligase
MQLMRTPHELAAFRPGDPRAIVMTMGALHDGHAELLRQARKVVGPDGVVIATVFVNPLQFGESEDFAMYPRSLESDLAVCDGADVDVVLSPDVDAVYPSGAAVVVEPGPIGGILEGASRPGHFRGVLTVVAKFLGMSRAQYALFGEKDYQQLTLIRNMVADLFLPVAIVPVPTVRDADGVAMSSRNRYLSTEERSRAAAIPQALQAAVAAAADGAEAAEHAGLEVLSAAGISDVDYFTVRGDDLGEPKPGSSGRVLAAVRIGKTRLIDNMTCLVGAR